jgi:hypothetical protein
MSRNASPAANCVEQLGLVERISQIAAKHASHFLYR